MLPLSVSELSLDFFFLEGSVTKFCVVTVFYTVHCLYIVNLCKLYMPTLYFPCRLKNSACQDRSSIGITTGAWALLLWYLPSRTGLSKCGVGKSIPICGDAKFADSRISPGTCPAWISLSLSSNACCPAPGQVHLHRHAPKWWPNSSWTPWCMYEMYLDKASPFQDYFDRPMIVTIFTCLLDVHRAIIMSRWWAMDCRRRASKTWVR